MNKPKVKLLGKDGNAFAIIGSVDKALKVSGMPEEKRKEVQSEMMSGDYGNLLRVAMKYCEVY